MSHIINRRTYYVDSMGGGRNFDHLTLIRPCQFWLFNNREVRATDSSGRKETTMLFMLNRIRLILRVFFGNPVRKFEFSDFVQSNVNNPTGNISGKTCVLYNNITENVR